MGQNVQARNDDYRRRRSKKNNLNRVRSSEKTLCCVSYYLFNGHLEMGDIQILTLWGKKEKKTIQNPPVWTCTLLRLHRRTMDGVIDQ